jgi:hypothetical protein
MIIYFLIIFLFRKLIKYIFKKKDYHTIFRSFFCLFISTLSMGISVFNWKHLINTPLEPNQYFICVNKFMLVYMLIDTGYFIYANQYRLELMIHHIICLMLYGFNLNKSILGFCAINEILSAFNWVGIIYPKFEYMSKLFRLYSIIFIRLFIWIYTIVFLSSCPAYFYIGLFLIFIFMSLDCYWTWIIISNYFRYKHFIKEKLKDKIKDKLKKKLKK